MPLHNHPLTESTYSVSQRRSGKAVTLAVDNAAQLLAPYLKSTRKPSCDQLRDILEPIVDGTVTLDSKAIGSIARGVKAQLKSGKIITPAPKINRQALDLLKSYASRSADNSSAHCMEVFDDVMNNTSNDQSWVVSRLLAGIQEKDKEYFSYKFITIFIQCLKKCVWYVNEK